MPESRESLLIIKTGSTLESLQQARGDFEDWIAAAAGLSLDAFAVIDVSRGGELPDRRKVSAAIVTGSPYSMADHHPWSEQTAAWLRDAVAAERPVLGICYGHQLLAHALGGQAGPNPAGREIGVCEVEIVESDPLLDGLGSPLRVYETHNDAVSALPAGAQVLARNANSPIPAFAFRPRARGVQWHPEFDAGILKGYIEERAEEIDAELGTGTAGRLRDGAVELPGGRILVRNFLRKLAAVIRSGP
jgi:GMP synthase (glutamine-hydrolysing)